MNQRVVLAPSGHVSQFNHLQSFNLVKNSHKVRWGFLGNWGHGLQVFTAIILGISAAATHYSLNRIEATSADLNLSLSRCFIEAPDGLSLEGFSPISDCSLFRTQQIHFGPGKIVIDGGPSHEANEVSFLLAKKRSTSVVRIECNDLAVGKLSTGAGDIDIQSPGVNQLRVDVVPYFKTSVSQGELSLGDSCRISAIGYDLTIDGETLFQPSGKEINALFIPYGGVGKFSDIAGGISLQLTLVDRDFAFDKPLPIADIGFLDANNQCAGVASGSIRIGNDKDGTVVPGDSCVRLEGHTLMLRHLGMVKNTSEIKTSLNGQFRLLELNGTKLVSRSTWAAVIIGLVIFFGFAGLIQGAKNLLTKNE